MVHWEIQAKDPEKLREFYSALFNWRIGDGPIMAIPASIGGPGPGPGGHIQRGDTSRVVLYVQVRDLQASLNRAAELEGTILRAPFDVPGGTTIAGIADPEGNQVVLVQQ